MKSKFQKKNGANGNSHSKRGPKALRIVVADDHAFMREMIVAMLTREDGRYTVVGEAESAAAAIACCEKHAPDLLILDINLPDMSGIDAVPKIKKVSPNTRILLCTAYVTDDRILDALRCGAHGFVEKTNTWSDFIDAIDRVGGGDNYFCSHNSADRMESATPRDASAASTVGLSTREKEVLGFIAEGFTSKEIAAKLGISVATVDTHRANLMSKLHIRNVAGLVVFAFRAGLIKVAVDRAGQTR